MATNYSFPLPLIPASASQTSNVCIKPIARVDSEHAGTIVFGIARVIVKNEDRFFVCTTMPEGNDAYDDYSDDEDQAAAVDMKMAEGINHLMNSVPHDMCAGLSITAYIDADQFPEVRNVLSTFSTVLEMSLMAQKLAEIGLAAGTASKLVH